MQTIGKETRCGAWQWIFFAVSLAACGEETAAKPPHDTVHDDAGPLPEASRDAEPASDATYRSQPTDAAIPSMGDATSDASTPGADAPSSNVADAMSGADASDGEAPVTTGSFSVLALAELGGVHG